MCEFVLKTKLFYFVFFRELRRVKIVWIVLSVLITKYSIADQSCSIGSLENLTENLQKCNNPTEVKFLVFTVKKMGSIPQKLINSTLSVKFIDMSNTSLDFVNRSLNVCQWPYLASIDLNENNITELGDGILNDCHQLTSLNLAKSNIGLIYENAFQGLSQLKKLDLSNNQISALSDLTFKPLPLLRSLLLNNNQIASIATDNFAYNTKLVTLDLSYNTISTIQNSSFSKLSELTLLNIQCNPPLKVLNLRKMDKLREVNAFNASLTELFIPKSVETLNADDNKITLLTIEQNSTLNVLSLKNNFLRNLNDLTPAKNLSELDISNNNITDIDFAPLMASNIQKITLLENPIHSFNVTILTSLPNIRLIEVSTSFLDDSILKGLLLQTQRKKIQLMDPNRESESHRIVTLPPVTPVMEKTNTTMQNKTTADMEITTVKSTTIASTTINPMASNASSNSEKNSNATNISTIEELIKRIQKLESISDNSSTHKELNVAQSEIEKDVSNLWFMVICLMISFFIFMVIQITIFVKANYHHWPNPMSTVFSGTPNGRLSNQRRNPFHDSMDPIIEEVL